MASRLAEAEGLARRGFWNELGELIDREPDLAHLQDESGCTLLMICAGLGGSAATLQRLAELGANPNHRAGDGSTALSAAICGGSRHGLTTLPELTTLLQLGADPEAVADSGMPALHWAVAQHRLEHAKILLDHGASLDTLTSDNPPESVDEIARRIHSSAAQQLLQEYRNRLSST